MIENVALDFHSSNWQGIFSFQTSSFPCRGDPVTLRDSPSIFCGSSQSAAESLFNLLQRGRNTCMVLWSWADILREVLPETESGNF